MTRAKTKAPLDLLTPEGAQALRERPGVADLLENNRWLSTLVAALIPGCLTGAGLAFGGESAAWAFIGAAAVTFVVAVLIVGLSIVLGRPIVPELFVGENEPGELLEGLRWDTEAKAARAARNRNLDARSGGGYWIEVEVEPGVWGIEQRGLRRHHGTGDWAGGDWGWFGDGGGGGGGDGGGS